MTRRLLVLVGMLCASVPAVGQWSQIGPEGGNVFQLVTDPVTVTTSYAYTAAGLYKTIDGGDSWTDIDPGRLLRNPAVSPADPDVIYAVDGSLVPPTAGIYKSIDGGATWTIVLGTTSFDDYVESLAVDPTNASIVYACRANGLYKTIDGGATWSQIGASLPFVTRLVINPLTPSVLYAEGSAGAFKSTDAGMTWAGLSEELIFLTIDPQNPAILYGLGDSHEVVKSVDGGDSWTPTASIGFPPSPIWAFAIDPQTPSVLYVTHGWGEDGGLAKSDPIPTTFCSASSGSGCRN